MPHLFKYFSLMVLAGWMVGTLFFGLNGAIHLFLVIGVYAIVLGYGAEYAKRNKRPVSVALLLPISTSNNMVGILDSPAEQAMIAVAESGPITLIIKPIIDPLLKDVADLEAEPQPTRLQETVQSPTPNPSSLTHSVVALVSEPDTANEYNHPIEVSPVHSLSESPNMEHPFTIVYVSEKFKSAGHTQPVTVLDNPSESPTLRIGRLSVRWWPYLKTAVQVQQSLKAQVKTSLKHAQGSDFQWATIENNFLHSVTVHVRPAQLKWRRKSQFQSRVLHRTSGHVQRRPRTTPSRTVRVSFRSFSLQDLHPPPA